MSSPKAIAYFLSLLSIIFSLQKAHAADPLGYSCLSPNNFTSGSPYELNLIKLIGRLYLKTPPIGYGEASVGRHPDQTYGLGLCRGDISSWACLDCLTKAGPEALKLCPGTKGAVIWYDECMVKYMDQDFFGQIDTSVAVYLWNGNNVSAPLGLFNQKSYELLGQLADEASMGPKRYASGHTEVGYGNDTIYGLAQCTRDLSSSDCKKCLSNEINQLPNCCEGKQGGRVLGESCNVSLYQSMNPI
ncbi:hypothetical protein Cgig2_015332 [Carnegiea gigantea]|uniref:Gnk2-homologous domain-containing protein n=1 Tax=Carnegiea gigantea TaxID=171969 RepID=A0A9Q1GUV8_9CARY|nr:hypothetical protein Cgig2_015332 [Carnegiea gigantea]